MRVEIPGAAPNPKNLREHWARGAKRTKTQRTGTLLAFLERRAELGVVVRAARRAGPGELVAVLTRIAPRALDGGDNLPRALSAYRDALAELVGIDDGDARWSWHYDQRKGLPREESVLVEVLVRSGG